MSTKRIYQEDAYCSANEAVVTAVIQENGADVFACDASCFFPEGGGQPSDTGRAVTGKSRKIQLHAASFVSRQLVVLS